MKGTRIILVNILLVCLFLFTIFPISVADSEVSTNYHESVKVGASFVWMVKKYDVKSADKPEASDMLKRGDEIEVKVIENPSSNATELFFEQMWFGGRYSQTAECVKLFLNGQDFDSLGFSLVPINFAYGWIFPLTFTDNISTYDYFEQYYNNQETNSYLTQTLTDEYYESEVDFENDISKQKNYMRVDRTTGMILEIEEEFRLKSGELDAKVTIRHESYNTVVVNFSFNSMIGILTIIAISVTVYKKRKQTNLS